MKVSVKLSIILTFLLWGCVTPIKIIPGHAHNDYENKTPLFEALHNGFSSIEVDVHLKDGELIVSHNYPETQNTSTLESLYLEPLKQIFSTNQGEVYKKQKEPIILLVDFKSDTVETYEVLKLKLKPYAGLLSRFENGLVSESSIKIVVSGNRPIEKILNEEMSHLFLDGRPDDLGRDIPSTRMPLISENFRKLSSWKGYGEMDPNEKTKLRDIIERSHKEGRKVRFWGSPDNPEVWRFLLEHDVDFINTDDVKEFAKYYWNHIGT